MELYRHFVRLPDGSICELEQKLAYSVDDYPLFEGAAPVARERAFTDMSGFPTPEREKKANEDPKQDAPLPPQPVDLQVEMPRDPAEPAMFSPGHPENKDDEMIK